MHVSVSMKIRVECPRCGTKSNLTCWDLRDFITIGCKGCEHSIIFMDEVVTTMETSRINKILNKLGSETIGRVDSSDLSGRDSGMELKEEEVRKFIEKLEKGDDNE